MSFKGILSPILLRLESSRDIVSGFLAGGQQGEVKPLSLYFYNVTFDTMNVPRSIVTILFKNKSFECSR